jgi:hypothetical protein
METYIRVGRDKLGTPYSVPILNCNSYTYSEAPWYVTFAKEKRNRKTEKGRKKSLRDTRIYPQRDNYARTKKKKREYLWPLGVDVMTRFKLPLENETSSQQ